MSHRHNTNDDDDGETGHAGYADIAVSLAVKSVVEMLKMWVHKRTRAENNPTNHYQCKV